MPPEFIPPTSPSSVQYVNVVEAVGSLNLANGQGPGNQQGAPTSEVQTGTVAQRRSSLIEQFSLLAALRLEKKAKTGQLS